MSPETLAHQLSLLLGVAALMALWQFYLRPTMVEGFRQSIFSIRRDMFMFMAAGGIASDDPAYVLMCRSMNGMLRYAEGITIWRVLFSLRTTHSQALAAVMTAKIRRLPSPAAEQMTYFRICVGREIVRHVAFSSMLVWLVLIVPIAVLAVLKATLSSVQRGWTRLWQRHADQFLGPATQRVEAEVAELVAA